MVGEFFDKAVYHLARGYEGRAERAPQIEVRVSWYLAGFDCRARQLRPRARCDTRRSRADQTLRMTWSQKPRASSSDTPSWPAIRRARIPYWSFTGSALG